MRGAGGLGVGDVLRWNCPCCGCWDSVDSLSLGCTHFPAVRVCGSGWDQMHGLQSMVMLHDWWLAWLHRILMLAALLLRAYHPQQCTGSEQT